MCSTHCKAGDGEAVRVHLHRRVQTCVRCDFNSERWRVHEDIFECVQSQVCREDGARRQMQGSSHIADGETPITTIIALAAYSTGHLQPGPVPV